MKVVEEPAAQAQVRAVAYEEAPELPGGAPAPCGSNPLHSVKVELQVCVGTVSMTVAQLLSAREQDVFTLEQAVQDPVDLVLDGRVVARGQLVAVDGRFGMRITELPLPLGI
jgi:flagellar motor switch protein FliN/FliY